MEFKEKICFVVVVALPEWCVRVCVLQVIARRCTTRTTPRLVQDIRVANSISGAVDVTVSSCTVSMADGDHHCTDENDVVIDDHNASDSLDSKLYWTGAARKEGSNKHYQVAARISLQKLLWGSELQY